MFPGKLCQYEVIYTSKIPLWAKNDKDVIRRAKCLASSCERIKQIKKLGKKPEIIYKEE